MRQTYHPLHPESIGAHAEVRTPGSIGHGHRNPTPDAERSEHAIGFGLVIGDDRDVKVVAESDGRTKAIDSVACHEVHGLGDRSWACTILDFAASGTFGMNDVSPNVWIMVIFVPKTVS